jgi:hypothetical protein
MKRAHPEDDLQMAVASYLDRCLGAYVYWCHIPNGGKRNKREAGRLKSMGVKAGVADILLLFGGRPFFIELKAPKGTASDGQKEFRKIVERQSIKYIICRSLDEVMKALDEWKIPTIGRLGV